MRLIGKKLEKLLFLTILLDCFSSKAKSSSFYQLAVIKPSYLYQY